MEPNANLPLVLTNLVYSIVIKNFQEKYRHLFTSFFLFVQIYAVIRTDFSRQ